MGKGVPSYDIVGMAATHISLILGSYRWEGTAVGSRWGGTAVRSRWGGHFLILLGASQWETESLAYTVGSRWEDLRVTFSYGWVGSSHIVGWKVPFLHCWVGKSRSHAVGSRW